MKKIARRLSLRNITVSKLNKQQLAHLFAGDNDMFNMPMDGDQPTNDCNSANCTNDCSNNCTNDCEVVYDPVGKDKPTFGPHG